MSFPTTSILDTFTRADSPTTLGTNWTKNTGWFGDNIGISSNSAYNPSGASGGFWTWNVNSFTGTMEAYVTMSTAPVVANAGIGFTTNTNPATTDMYYIGATPSSIAVNVRLAHGGSSSQIGTFPKIIGTGDSVGASLTSSGLMTIYYKVSGNSWTSLGNLTDTTISCSYISILIQDTTVRCTNFGGGTQTSGSSKPSSTMALLGVG